LKGALKMKKCIIVATILAASVGPATAGGMGQGCVKYSAQLEEPVVTAIAEPSASTPLPAPEVYPSTKIPVDTATLIEPVDVPANTPVKGM
jgi:hypothetical protein